MISDQHTIALVGNLNFGKTTLFNARTGTDQRIGNWPGVTVERREGRVSLGGGHARLAAFRVSTRSWPPPKTNVSRATTSWAASRDSPSTSLTRPT